MPPIVYVVTKLLLVSHLIGLEKTFQSIILILLKGIDFLLVYINKEFIYS